MTTTTDFEAPPPRETFQPVTRRKRGPSGALLFFMTLGSALLLILISTVSLSALDGDNPEAAFIVPALCVLVWVIFFVVLLYFAGRAISDNKRPGEAGTAIVLGFFLTPVVFASLPVAVAAQSALGVASLLGGESSVSPLDDGFAELEGVEELDTVDGYGTDPELDALYDACEGGETQACDDLWAQSPAGSEYEQFAIENGGGA